jgi:hypothetical protein
MGIMDNHRERTLELRKIMRQSLPGRLEDGLIWMVGVQRGYLHRACDVRLLLEGSSCPKAYEKLERYLYGQQELSGDEDRRGDMIINGESILD